MILLVFRRKKLRSVLVFDLTSFPDKIYHWREALKRRNFDTSPFTEWSPAIFAEFELT